MIAMCFVFYVPKCSMDTGLDRNITWFIGTTSVIRFAQPVWPSHAVLAAVIVMAIQRQGFFGLALSWAVCCIGQRAPEACIDMRMSHLPTAAESLA